jgi:arginine-tRNA-protein transferase
MARSLRVNLLDFKETSENRRVLKKIEELNPGFQVVPINEFDTEQESFKTFCFEFAKERFTEPISIERIEYILKWKNLSHVFEFFLNDKKVGFVLCIISGGTLHYWFAFFDLNYPAYSLGKYMMYSVINWAFEQKMEAVYLGTCYGEKALYKARDFKGLEFFDGNIWNSDMKLLKEKCKSDASFELDHFKKDKNYFLID